MADSWARRCRSRRRAMPEFSYTIVGPATIYSQHPLEAAAPTRDVATRHQLDRSQFRRQHSAKPSVSEQQAKKTVAFARECAVAFAKDCMEMNHRALAASNKTPISTAFDDTSRQYTVHAMFELHAALADVLEVFETSDAFMARVFDGGLKISQVLAYPAPEPTPDGETSTTSLKKGIFDERVSRKQLMCLEHVTALSPTSVVRYYESVDDATKTDRHENLTFGYFFEKVSRSNRLRLTFYGCYILPPTKSASALGQNDTCKLLQKLGTSIDLLTKIVLRRRLALELPQAQSIQMDAPPPLPVSTNPGACTHCKKTFRLFRRAIECQLCRTHVCAKCSRHEEVETTDGLVTRVHVCHVCFKHVQDKYTQEPKRRSSRRKDDALAMVPAYQPMCRCGRPSSGPCGECAAACCPHCSVIDQVAVGKNNTMLDLRLCHACALGRRHERSRVVSNPIILHDTAPATAHTTELMRTVSLSEKKVPSKRYLRKSKSVMLFDPASLPELCPEEDTARPSSHGSVAKAAPSPTPPVALPPPPSHPESEETLVEQVRHFACLDVGTNDLHDDLCRAATTDLLCGNAYVTLIYQGAFILKGGHGSSVPAQVPADCALTAATVDNGDELTVVPDASADSRFSASPRVTGREGIRFYCGLPLVTMDGLVLGAVAVADSSPRLRMPTAHVEAMHVFRDAVVELIESRLQAALEMP
ncbi:hypothetical protein ACHHYP_15484 [Achlya hypogyna]|uniref:FYVE-type domain-containing protein n=1 Tax=Achlya hypogyna TaxID=1202772 RepID=A0A1V9ZES7_ACHHY|nr:hypothetical protein ACHHYP_15484 [Achlya hypogyna]